MDAFATGVGVLAAGSVHLTRPQRIDLQNLVNGWIGTERKNHNGAQSGGVERGLCIVNGHTLHNAGDRPVPGRIVRV
jgi:hypothetical protein